MPDSAAGKTLTTTTTSGTGTYSLSTVGPSNESYRTVKQAVADGSLADGDQVTYVCFDGSVVNDVSFEVGEGTYDDTANTLTRDTIYDGSNGPGTPVSWPASGQRVIYIATTHDSVLPRTDRVNTFSQDQRIDGNLRLNTPTATGALTVMDDRTSDRGDHIVVQGLTDTTLKGYFGIDTDAATPQLLINFVDEGVAFKDICIASKGSDVAIGHNSPSAQLDVNKGVILNSSGGLNDVQIKGGTDDNLGFFDASADSVGFGTSGPLRKVHVKQAATNCYVRVESTALNGAAGIECLNDTLLWQLRVATDDKFGIVDATNSKFPFTIEPNAPSDSLYVNSVGQVGIGTSSPSKSVHVVDSGDADLILEGTNSASTAYKTSAQEWKTGVLATNDF